MCEYGGAMAIELATQTVLASEATSHVTGEIVTVSGGRRSLNYPLPCMPHGTPGAHWVLPGLPGLNVV